MSIGYTKAFEKIAALKKPLRVLCGGSSASKTTSILQYLILLAFKKELLISVVAQTNAKLMRGAYLGQYGFIDILKKMGIYDVANHNQTKQSYTLGKSKFEFFPADTDFSGRRDILFLNECDETEFSTYNELNSRTNLFTILDFNPKKQFWVHSEILGKIDCDFLTLTYLDNDFILERTKKELESYKELGKTSAYYANRWRVMGQGLLGIQQGAIYTDWEEIEELPIDAELIASGLDFGFSSDPTALCSVYRYNDDIIVDEVIYKTGLFNRQLADLIKKTDGINGIIYADSASPQNIAELRSFGINVIGVTKGPGSIEYGISLVQQKHLKITKRSENLIKELQGYVWQTDKSGKELGVPKGADHILDGLRYVFRMKFANKKTTFGLKWKK